MKAGDLPGSVVVLEDVRRRAAQDVEAVAAANGAGSPAMAVMCKAPGVVVDLLEAQRARLAAQRTARESKELAAVALGVAAGDLEAKWHYLAMLESHPDMERVRTSLAKHARPGGLGCAFLHERPFVFTNVGIRVAVTDNIIGDHVRPIEASDLASSSLEVLQRLGEIASELANDPRPIDEAGTSRTERRMPEDTTPRAKLAALRESEQELAAGGVFSRVADYDVPSARAWIGAAAWTLKGTSEYMVLTGEGLRILYDAMGTERLRPVTLDDMARLPHVEIPRVVGVGHLLLLDLDNSVRYAKATWRQRIGGAYARFTGA